VEGRLRYEEWQKDGKTQSRIRVHADRVQFLGQKNRASADDLLSDENPAPKTDTDE